MARTKQRSTGKKTADDWYIHKARLQAYARGTGVDRLIYFCLPRSTPTRSGGARRIIIEANDLRDARWKFRELREAARVAVRAGEAREFLDRLDRRVQESSKAGPRFRAHAKEWFETCVEGVLRESTIQGDRGNLDNHLLPFFGDYLVTEIDPRLVDRFKAKKRKQKHQYGEGYAAKTINNMLSTLHRAMEKAIEYGLIQANPVTKRAWLRVERTPEDRQNWWTPAEEELAVETLLRWQVERPLPAMVVLTQLLTGLRFSEIRALRKEDLDLQTPGLWVRRSQARKTVGTPKNKRARFHVIARELAQELRKWMMRTEGQLLFPGVNGGPLSNNVLNRWYRQLAEEAEVRPITSHGARHTSGSSYAVMGAGQQMIARLLGHKNVASTGRYTHVQVEQTQPIVEARWARLKPNDDK